jgi:PEP-CTERM motif
MRFSAIVGGFAFGSLISSAAFADITVTNYSLPDPSSFGSVTTDGYSYYTGPIVLSTTIGSLTVYCADLNHDIYGGTTYTYAYGALTENGLGDPLSQPLSNELGQIAEIGKSALAHGNDDLAAAAQAAIWGLEYSTTPSFAVPTGAIATDFGGLLAASYKNDGAWGVALIPVGEGWPGNLSATQQMVVGVPEPSTWALMLFGFAGLGFVGYRSRRAPSLPAERSLALPA